MILIKLRAMKDGKFVRLFFLPSLFYIGIPVWQFVSLSCSSPSNEKVNLNFSDTTKINSNTLTQLTPEEKLKRLEIERVFWKNRVQLAQDETVDLIVDLVDSIMLLEIKGVPVRECKIHDYSINKSLSELKRNHNVLDWLAHPFNLREEWSNIPKEPIKIREINASDSTTEGIINFYKEELPDIQVALLFSGDLTIYIDQNDGFPSDSCVYKFLNKELSKKVKYLVMLKISAVDIKAIYRSLSDNSGLSFRY